MSIDALWLTDFRCFVSAEFQLHPTGLTVLRGENAAGKTSILEAIGWLATRKSMRGAPRDALVRRGAATAIVRGRAVAGERTSLVEAEIPAEGSPRMLVNRQTVRGRSQLTDTLEVTVFAPADLELVQGGPALRRQYLDDVLVGRHPRLESLVAEVDRISRQRAAVLRQAGGRVDDTLKTTLDIWDERLAVSGTALATERAALATELVPLAGAAYTRLAGAPQPVGVSYRRSWDGNLADALRSARPDDVRRQQTTVGPHHDELDLTIGLGPARTQASQGEQRSLALALRLATHELRRTGRAEPPVLLLDDVFSELDARRSSALVELLPPGQVLLTTAVDPPSAMVASEVVDVGEHVVRAPAGAP